MTQVLALPFDIPPNPPEEDKRKATLFLRALGLNDTWADYYAGLFTLKDNINNALLALGMSSGERKNYFSSFVTSRIPLKQSGVFRDIIDQALVAHPHLLSDEELALLADSIKAQMNRERPQFLNPDSKEIEQAQKLIDQNPAYKDYPALILLRAIGIMQPEKMTHDGFMHASSLLLYKMGETNVIATNLPPLPVAKDGRLHKLLLHPTPLVAALIGQSIRKAGGTKISSLVTKLNELIENGEMFQRTSEVALDESPDDRTKEKSARRFAVEYLMGHLTDNATGRPISPTELSPYFVEQKISGGYCHQNFLCLVINEDRMMGAMHYLIESVQRGQYRYNGRFPLENFATPEGTLSIGSELADCEHARIAAVRANIAVGQANRR